MNPSIQKLLLGKSEEEAIAILVLYKCKYRILFRDGRRDNELAEDRDDNRYGLVIAGGKVERIIGG